MHSTCRRAASAAKGVSKPASREVLAADLSFFSEGPCPACHHGPPVPGKLCLLWLPSLFRPPLFLGVLGWAPRPDGKPCPCDSLPLLLCCLSNLPASAERPDERTSRVLSPDFLSSLKVRETRHSLIVSPQAQPSPSPGAPCPQKAPRRGVAPGATGETRSGRPPALCSSRRRLLCPRSRSGLK